MKLISPIFAIWMVFVAGTLSGQPPQKERLYFPFLDKESQSNVEVAACDFEAGQTCPLKYTNVLSNTNLFTLEEQEIIRGVFVKYKNVTTNSGPLGTRLVDLHKTNFVIRAMNRTVDVEDWIANYQYTNFDAREQIRFGAGILAVFQTSSNDGYNASFTRTGGGTLLSFGELKHGLPNGLFARFDDGHPQGLAGDCKLANFTDSVLEEYRQYTNGMVLGKFFMWNPRNNNLMLEAEFKEPYDFEKQRIDLKMLQQH